MSPRATTPGRVAEWIREARTILALTGAGISTDSGIMDFRGPNGLWTTNPRAERLSDIRYYMSDPSVREEAWQARLVHPAWTAEPNSGHHALATLERKGKLDGLVTQNVDGLHQRAGSSPDRLVEIHGTIHDVVCMGCAERAPMQLALDRVRAGEADPPCRSCGGILKSATISFGQALDRNDLARAQQMAGNADLFLAIGTSLQVYPVAFLPEIARSNGAQLVIVNAEATPFDAVAQAVIRDRIGDVLPEIAELV